jgi:hypothetical protein
MLNFYRPVPQSYTIEDQAECLPQDPEGFCPEEPNYTMPMLPGDIIKFIVDVAEAFPGYDGSTVKVGISSCGMMVHEDIGTIEVIDNQAYVTATVPEEIEPGCYEFIFYSIYDPIDCSTLEGATIEDICDLRLVQWCHCTFADFGCLDG